MSKRNEIGPEGVTGNLARKTKTRRKTLEKRVLAGRDYGHRRNDVRPPLRLVERPLASLHLPRRRVKLDEPAQIARVRGAVETLGFDVPLLITSDDEIIDGATRAEAARQLGMSTVPCIVVESLTAEEIRLLRLSVNRLAERGEWDFNALRIEFNDLIDLGAPIDVVGFDPSEIDAILMADEVETHETGPVEPEADESPIAQQGDLWALGDHLVACGDARDLGIYEVLFDDRRQAQLLLTDVPYNVPIRGHVTSGRHREFGMASGEMSAAEFADFNVDWLTPAVGVVADGGLVGSFIDWRSVDVIIGAGRALGLTLINVIAWVKDNAGMGSLYRSQHELLPLFKRGHAPHVNHVELGKGGRYRSNVWTYPGASTMGSDARSGLKLHPTVKPTAMLVDALLDVTDRGDIVLDPFLGSGSTLIAGEKTGRICRGIELDPLYVDVILRRWRGLTGRDPKLLASAGRPRPAARSEPLLLPKPRLRIPARRAEG